MHEEWRYDDIKNANLATLKLTRYDVENGALAMLLDDILTTLVRRQNNAMTKLKRR